MIECPWRIRQEEVTVGKSDCVSAPNKYSYHTVNQILQGKKITNVYHFESVSDLIIKKLKGLTYLFQYLMSMILLLHIQIVWYHI
jgi:hypothetical protein